MILLYIFLCVSVVESKYAQISVSKYGNLRSGHTYNCDGSNTDDIPASYLARPVIRDFDQNFREPIMYCGNVKGFDKWSSGTEVTTDTV